MEMNKKYARTTQQQLRWYVAFVKDRPELLQGKNTPKAPKLLSNLWQEISTNLNAMVGPSRSCDAWRESLRNWRKQLRARARKAKAEQNTTGGGRSLVPELTDFEQHALEVFGMSAIEGHSNIVLGFPAENEENNSSPILEVVPADCIALSPTSLDDIIEVSADINPSHFETNIEAPSPSTPVAPVSRSRKNNFRTEILKMIENDRKERREEQSKLAESLNNLGKGLSALAGAVHELVELQKRQQNFCNFLYVIFYTLIFFFNEM